MTEKTLADYGVEIEWESNGKPYVPSQKSIDRAMALIEEASAELADMVTDAPTLRAARKAGMHQGRHFIDYVDDVKALKRSGNLEEAETLLHALIEAMEREAAIARHGVAPWYYEQLVIVYGKRKDRQNQIELLKRFAKQKHAPGALTTQLLARLKRMTDSVQEPLLTKQ